MDKVRLKVEKDEVTIEEGENSFLGKLLEGAKGKVKIKTPFGVREIHKVKNIKGKVFKDEQKREKASK